MEDRDGSGGGAVPHAGGAPGNVACVDAPPRTASLRRDSGRNGPCARAGPALRRVDGGYAPARTADYAPAWYEL
ncbi:hypothetical protein GCM10023257_14560 [Streptomyces hyderabadensis]|uniref:DUF397 domain-containing protein n=1 Tax=Streptomyces hyderabadensis TaxID=598549 RepID=A0ABP9HTD2_9ACTN